MPALPNRFSGIARSVAVISEHSETVVEAFREILQFSQLILSQRFGWKQIQHEYRHSPKLHLRPAGCSKVSCPTQSASRQRHSWRPATVRRSMPGGSTTHGFLFPDMPQPRHLRPMLAWDETWHLGPESATLR